MEIRRKRCFAADGMFNFNCQFWYICGWLDDLRMASFRLLTHLGVNNIRAKGVLIKNGLRRCTIIGDKQLQIKERGHFKQRTSSKKAA